MTITADLGGKNYTLGRGRVFFDRYPANVAILADTKGEGERYFGNTPEFSTTSESEDLEHFDADAGIKTKDDSVQLSMSRTGSFVTDNISSENIALYFLGNSKGVTQTASTALVETCKVKPGLFYQLGTSPSLPAGLRNIKNVVIKKGAGFAVTVATSDYQVDEDLGRVYILPTAVGITAETEVQITYDTDASTREQIISSSNSIYGAIRFVSNNPKGVNRDYYFPYVKLSPDGDYNLKGDEWMTIGFTMEILKKGSLESVYVDTRPVKP